MKKNNGKRVIALLAFMIASLHIDAQTTIRSGTELKVKGELSAVGPITNNSDKSNLAEAQLRLTGTNQTLTTSSPLSLQNLVVEGGGVKTVQGEWTITNNLTLTKGILAPGTGKLLYTGSTTLSGNTTSFVNGTLNQRGTGVRFFPIGAGTTYMPLALGNVQDGTVEIGVKGFASGANLTLPLDVSAIASNRYWQITTNGGTFQGSPVSLYVPGASIDASPRLVVVQADDANGATAVNVGGGTTNDFVTSFSIVNKPIVTLGISEETDFRIHDMITPFNSDNINDRLKILNVELTFSNKVILLDRWGVVVKQWNDFRNYDDPKNPNADNFDFGKLGPGNYICIFEYQLTAGAPTEKMSQMITVLKGN